MELGMTVRIVDPRNQDGESRGDGWRNLGAGRRRRQAPGATRRTGDVPRAAHSLAGTSGRRLRTGDLGVIFEGELFIIKVASRAAGGGWGQPLSRHQATIQEITGGRVEAIAVRDHAEKLVTIIELMGVARMRRKRSTPHRQT